jgi:hypothetical protein
MFTPDGQPFGGGLVFWAYVALAVGVGGVLLTLVEGLRTIRGVSALASPGSFSFVRPHLIAALTCVLSIAVSATYLKLDHARDEAIGRDAEQVSAVESRLAREILPNLPEYGVTGLRHSGLSSFREKPVVIVIDGDSREVSWVQSKIVPRVNRPDATRQPHYLLIYRESWKDSPGAKWTTVYRGNVTSERAVRVREWQVTVWDLETRQPVATRAFVGPISGSNFVNLIKRPMGEEEILKWEEQCCLAPTVEVLRWAGIWVDY